MSEQVKQSKFLDTRIKSANVSMKETIFGYVLGPLFGLMSSGITAGYMLKYWKNTLGLSGDFLTFLPLVSVVFIVIGNLVVGQLIDRTKSRHGKARPYILASAVLITIASILFFAVPQGDEAFMYIWIAIAYNLYYAVAYPLYFTSNASLVGLSTRNGKHRGILSSATNLAHTGAAAGGPLIMNFVLSIMGESASTYLITILLFGALSFLFVGLQYFFTRERVTEENIKLGISDKKIPVKQQIKAVVTDKYWWMIIAFYVVFQLCGMIQNSSLAFYNDFVFGKPNDPITYTVLQLVPGIVLGAGALFSWPLSNKIGKKNAVCIGMVVSIVGCAVSFIAPNLGLPTGIFSATWWVQLVGICIIRLGAGPANYVMLALFADVLDHDEAKNGFRSDGFSMSLFSIIMAVATSVAQSIINAVLDGAGYVEYLDENKQIIESAYEANKANVGGAVSWLFLGFMMVGYVVCIVALLFLKVEKFSEKDKADILEHQKTEVLAQGKEWIEPQERLRLEQEQADAEAEQARKDELKARCDKKGLSFDAEEAKYQAKLASKASKKK